MIDGLIVLEGANGESGDSAIALVNGTGCWPAIAESRTPASDFRIVNNLWRVYERLVRTGSSLSFNNIDEHNIGLLDSL